VARLGDEAQELDFAALDVSEWLVFVEGYLNVGRSDSAREVIEQMVSDGDAAFIRSDVCDLLDRVRDADVDTSAIESELDCGALLLILPR